MSIGTKVYTDLMIDIETLGICADCVIAQIGAVPFNATENGPQILFNISIESCCDLGLKTDASTILFWIKQSDTAIESVFFSRPRIHVKDALNQIQRVSETVERIWSHATYDFVCINTALRKFTTAQMDFRKARDIRTLTDLAGINPSDFKSIGTAHNALDDCLFQISYCREAMKKLGYWK